LHTTARAGRPSLSTPRAESAVSRETRLLRLQRQAGNNAVTASLVGRQPSVQRTCACGGRCSDCAELRRDSAIQRVPISRSVQQGNAIDTAVIPYEVIPGLSAAGASSSPPGRPTLRQGASGDPVQECQEKLNKTPAASAPLVTDGQFGPLTRVAVVDFQSAQGLEADGAVGPLTWTRLDATAATGSSVTSSVPAATNTLGVLAPAASLPGGQRLCFPPSAFADPQFASGFGTIAERFIENDYCDTLGCSAATVFIDNNNPTAYKAFLTAHNPSLRSGAKAVALTAASITGIARPDILNDDGVRRDFYEIKPLSPSGAAAGVEKLVEIAAFMALLGLPYVSGVTYSPSKDIPIMSGTILGEPIGVALNVQRFVPGIVTYSLCLRGNLAELLTKVALATLLAWIAAQLLIMAAGAVVVAA